MHIAFIDVFQRRGEKKRYKLQNIRSEHFLKCLLLPYTEVVLFVHCVDLQPSLLKMKKNQPCLFSARRFKCLNLSVLQKNYKLVYEASKKKKKREKREVLNG